VRRPAGSPPAGVELVEPYLSEGEDLQGRAVVTMAVEYDQDHFLLSFGGYSVAGHEQWQCGLRFDGPGVVPDEVAKAGFDAVGLQDIYDDVKAVIQTGALGCRYDTHTSLEFVKLAWINIDGTYKTDAREHRQVAKGVLNASMTSPPQLAVACSLWSGTKIGHANRGRFFMPMPNEWAAMIEPSSGMVVAAQVDTFRASLKTMLEAIKGEVATVQVPAQLSIFSPKTPKSVGVVTPSHKHVAQLGVGRTIDTQRSRRRSLPDGITTWSTLALNN
jgi:hypothetical protein